MASMIQPQGHVPVEPEKRRAFRAVDIAQALRNQNGLCACCCDPIAWFEADHIKPRDLLGLTNLDNLQLLCKPCHLIKSAQDIKRIRKAARLRKKNAAPETRALAKPKRPIVSRGFSKSLKRKLNGRVERR